MGDNEPVAMRAQARSGPGFLTRTIDRKDSSYRTNQAASDNEGLRQGASMRAQASAAGSLATLNALRPGHGHAGRLGIFTPMYFIHARKPE